MRMLSVTNSNTEAKMKLNSSIEHAFILVGLSNESALDTVEKIIRMFISYEARFLHLSTQSAEQPIRQLLAANMKFKPEMFEVFRNIVFIESGLVVKFAPSVKYKNTMNILVLSESIYNYFSIDILMTSPYPASLVHAAVLMEENELLHHILEFSKNPNIGTLDAHTTPLHLAAKEEYMTPLHLLLSHPNIDANITDILEDTPLTLASLENKTIAVRRLLEHPHINVKHKNSTGQNALIAAVINGNICIIEMILNHPAYLQLTPSEYGDIYEDILNNTSNRRILDYCYNIIFSSANDMSPNKINSRISYEIMNELNNSNSFKSALAVLTDDTIITPVNFNNISLVFIGVQLMLLIFTCIIQSPN
jgi:hypothetical protein